MENPISQIIAGCRIEKLLGQGAMGKVYKAWHLNLDIPVAMKFLDTGLSCNFDRIEQFFGEARAIACLNSQHIVRVMQVGEENGFYFIQMEYIDGESLQKKIEREAPFPFSLALNYIYQIALGLQIAHQQNIIHRDIKPDNVLIGQKGILKIVDFGLAKLLEKNIPANALEQISGSLHYLSPEQCEGKAADARSDIYSLGLNFYYMITGKLPFQGNSPLSIAISRLYSQPVSPLLLVPGLPEELEPTIQKMIARSLENRYTSISELLKDITPLVHKYPYILSEIEQTDAPLDMSEPEEIILPEKRSSESEQAVFSMEALENKLKNSLPPYPVFTEKKQTPPMFYFLWILVVFLSGILLYFFMMVQYKAQDIVFWNQKGPIAKKISGTWKMHNKNLHGTSRGFKEAQITWQMPSKPFRLSIEFLLERVHSIQRPGSKLEIFLQWKEKEYRIPFLPKPFMQYFTIEGNGKEIFFFGMEPPVPVKTKQSKENLVSLILKSAKIEIHHMEWSKK